MYPRAHRLSQDAGRSDDRPLRYGLIAHLRYGLPSGTDQLRWLVLQVRAFLRCLLDRPPLPCGRQGRHASPLRRGAGRAHARRRHGLTSPGAVRPAAQGHRRSRYKDTGHGNSTPPFCSNSLGVHYSRVKAGSIQIASTPATMCIGTSARTYLSGALGMLVIGAENESTSTMAATTCRVRSTRAPRKRMIAAKTRTATSIHSTVAVTTSTAMSGRVPDGEGMRTDSVIRPAAVKTKNSPRLMSVASPIVSRAARGSLESAGWLNARTMLTEDLPSGGIRPAVPQAGSDQDCRQTGEEASPDPGDSRDRRTAML